MQITMDKAQIGVTQMPGAQNIRVIVAKDIQSGIEVVMPLDEQAARQIASGLTSGLVLAHGKLPPPPGIS